MTRADLGIPRYGRVSYLAKSVIVEFIPADRFVTRLTLGLVAVEYRKETTISLAQADLH